MITIHHLKRPAGQRPSPETPEWTRYLDMTMFGTIKGFTKEFFKENYTNVADVQTNDKSEAWELTNTIDAPWYEGNRVLVSTKTPRSTSVGDIMEVWDTKHRFYLVARMGFHEVTDLIA